MGCLQLRFLVGRQLSMSIDADMTKAARSWRGALAGWGSACGVGLRVWRGTPRVAWGSACGVGLRVWDGAPRTGEVMSAARGFGWLEVG